MDPQTHVEAGLIRSGRDAPGLLHQALRTATRAEHSLLDRMILRLDLSVRRDYALFLQVHCSALQELSADSRDEDREDFRGMIGCLRNDLRVLGMPPVTFHPAVRARLTPANRLGAAYVVRGSRLGATVLRRRVKVQSSMSYFDFLPALDWEHFVRSLRDAAEGPQAVAAADVINGARTAFDLFAGLFTQALA